MSENKGLVLVVEDDDSIFDGLRMRLKAEGYGVAHSRDGQDALRQIEALRPAAIVLDIGLPKLDGTEVCRQLRSNPDQQLAWTPVLFLTARDEEYDRLHGLDLGADDYIVKTQGAREVAKRVTAVLRRTRPVPVGTSILELGAIALDIETHRATFKGEEVHLTVKEFDLLAMLMGKPGRVFTREELTSSVWGYAPMAGNRTIDVHIAQLKAKFDGELPVRTVRGVGYAIEKP
jgi:DNA-binding response OmpR family regulator